MLVKTLAIGAIVASLPLCLIAARPDFAPAQTPGESTPTLDHAALERLQRELREARAEAKELREELQECLDHLDLAVMPAREPNCTPSRSLLFHYQWLDQRGHDERKKRVLDKISEQHHGRPERLDALARELMDDKETAGKFDRAALALTERALAAGSPRPRTLDTAALAHFLNGHVDDAVRLQREALGARDEDEYRRRLRVYEAAQAAVGKSAAVPSATIAAGD
jgi:hypothetical protein